jgi:hypothetical protein
LPTVVPDASLPPTTTTVAEPVAVTAHSRTNSIFDSTPFAFLILLVGLLPLGALRRRVVVKGMQQRARQRRDERTEELVPAGRLEYEYFD